MNVILSEYVTNVHDMLYCIILHIAHLFIKKSEVTYCS
jgi:hypothetical protein